MRGAFVILLLIVSIALQCVLQSNSQSNDVFGPRGGGERDSNRNQYVNSSVNHDDAVAPKRRPKSLVALIFSNRTWSNNVTLPPTNMGTFTACKWLKGYKKQMQQCMHKRGFAKVLQDARKLAVTQCRHLFSFDRWDCTMLHNSMLKKIYRETSFMQAISAAALMFSVTKACSDGKLQGCYCLLERPKRDDSKWHGVGCADNTKIARRIARRFLLDNGGHGDQNGGYKLKLKQELYKNNINVGLQTVEQHKKKSCVCHGLSASCTMKTCWKNINRNFTMIAVSLKAKYNSALLYKPGLMDTNNKEIDQHLMYLEQSPNYCNTTRGRRCKDHNHCATLCCGRGSHEKNVIVDVRCNCKWSEDLVIGCKSCESREVHFICK